MAYDNRYNGALFATRDPKVLAGPFFLDNDQQPLRMVCQLTEEGGVHTIAVHAERADGKGLKKKPVARGNIRRNRSSNEDAPVARGRLTNGQKTVDLVLWLKESHGSSYYQVKPDTLTDGTPDQVPAL